MTPEPRDVIAAAILAAWNKARDWGEIADVALAALRAAGYETYRPEECETVWWCDTHKSTGGPIWCEANERIGDGCAACSIMQQRRLVPASDDTEGE